MSETDLQLGGGYTYQWECAILLALNYFFEPVRYNPTLFDLINDFLGQVAEIHLEGEDRESGVDLEDINLVNGDRRILIQVKTKQAEGERWTSTDPLLLKALYRFYDSRFFADQSEDTRFVFLTNRPFNRTLVRVKSAISEGTLAQCAEADKLCEHLARYAHKEKGKSVDADRFREMLTRTALVEYLAVDEVKANVQAKLQAHGRPDWEEAHALLFEHFARQSTRIGGGTVTCASLDRILGLQRRVQIFLHGDFSSFGEERQGAVIDALAGLLRVSSQAIQVYSVHGGSVVFELGLPLDAAQRLRQLLQSNNDQLRLLRIEKVTLEASTGRTETWILDKGRFRLASDQGEAAADQARAETIVSATVSHVTDSTVITAGRDVYMMEREPSLPLRPIPFQLPRRAVHFQGREQELTTLLEHLRPGAAVTLCGPGGIGKTALAAEALARLPEDRFPDGIIFHTFYRQPEAALALEHIARSYGHDPRPTPADAARMALAGRRALLVLDGAEEAEDLKAVLACVGKCGVLITSRRRGDVPDPALRFDLGPLEEAQAVALLQVWGGRRADDEEATHAICRLVGGLPLGIQLAGAYLARTDEEAADYLAWLETTPLVALDFGQQQHESVPVLMARSLERVSEQARAALGLVGLMGLAPFGREAIAAALGIEERATSRVLGELVDYGLLIRQDSRYAVTHALVHTYARERLSPEEKARERLVAYYLALAQATDDHAVLNAERPHLLAALSDAHRRQDWETTLDFAKALDEWLGLQGHWMDRVSVLEQSLGAARGLGYRYLEGNRLGNLGLLYFGLGQAEQAIEYCQQALAIFRKVGDPWSEKDFLGRLGRVYQHLGQVEQAIECYNQALQSAREIGMRRWEMAALGSLGAAYDSLGQVEQAIEYYTQALEIAHEIGDCRMGGIQLSNLGNTYADLGRMEQAIEYYTQALQIAHEIGDQVGEGSALGNLGLAYQDLGQMEEAIEYCQQALAIFRKVGYRRSEGNCLGNLGIAYRFLGQVEQAIEYSKQALTIAREIGDRPGEGRELGHLGNAYSDLEQMEQAIECYTQALEIAREIGDRRNEGTILNSLGVVCHSFGWVEQAIEFYIQGLEIAREIGDRRREEYLLGNLASIYFDLRQVKQAIKCYTQVLEIAHEIGDRKGEGSALGNLGVVYYSLGQVEQAVEYYNHALQIAYEIGDQRGEGGHLSNLGLAYKALGDTTSAHQYFSQALAIFEEIKSPQAERVRRWLAELG